MSPSQFPAWTPVVIDPRTTLVLIRTKDGVWEPRTSEITEIADTVVAGRPYVEVRFARNPTKPWRYGVDRVRVFGDPVRVPLPDGARLCVGGKLWQRRSPSDVEVREFGRAPDSWRTVSYRSGQFEKHLIRPAEEVVIVDAVDGDGVARDVMAYWRQHVASRDREDPLVASYGSMQDIHPGSVLATYLNGAVPEPRETPQDLVFPFACNLSQCDAVRRALSHSISVIEGPPGTGKTQTILNLVANIVTADLGSVGVVSLGNSAVENVGEKLDAEGFGHIVAQLGNNEKLRTFLAAREERDALAVEFARTALHDPPSPAELPDVTRRFMRVLGAERDRAELRACIDALVLERRHFERHRTAGTAPELRNLPLLDRSSDRIIEFLAETQDDERTGRPGLVRRIRRYLRYGTSRGLDTGDAEVVLALQEAFYARRIAELERELADVERTLAAEDLDTLARTHRELSSRSFAAAVASRNREVPNPLRGGQIPRDPDGFAAFCRGYPVVLSTCHSLRRRLPTDELLDYLIIDEASQVDLLTASLAMASCRNLVVVGDGRQLAHIPGPPVPGITAPAPAYDCQEHSVLSSIAALYGDAVPTTLLREHYRCHPAIIGFSNAAFYEDALIPYTQEEGRSEPAMWIHTTAAGDHMRTHRGGGRTNQRELDVIEREVLAHAPVDIDARDVAIATPYRRQADKAAASLAERAETSDTVHRLQGRERRMVILSTVLSGNAAGRSGLRFVDDPRLVNVAVSRATDHFVLVTNREKLAGSRYLADLIGYIEYRYPDQQPRDSRVVSVFDLLYREYDDALERLSERRIGRGGSAAEQIVDAVLEDLLAEPEHAHLRVESQILLRNLVPDPDVLDDARRAFVGRRSSVDFVVYNRVTRRPVLAIEVDGFAFHENRPEQLRRDALKDGVLAQVGLSILRLPTTGSDEERRIREALAEAEQAAMPTA